MPIFSIIPLVSILGGLGDAFALGVALHKTFREKQRHEEEERRRDRQSHRERNVCVSCEECITNERGTRKIKCEQCKKAYGVGVSLYHEKCSEIGECGKCICCVCEGVMSDRYSTVTRCSLCKGESFRVHKECSDEVIICQGCREKKHLGKCPACPRLRTRHQLKKARCGKCDLKELVVHSACVNKAMECKECTDNKVIGTCDGCRKNVLAKHLTLALNSSCSSCNTEIVVHEECYKEVMECVECTDNKVMGTCDGCRKDILAKHQTINSSCSICDGLCVVHEGCYGEDIICMVCVDSKTLEVCFICNESLKKPGNKTSVNCPTCKNWRQFLHSECSISSDWDCPKCVNGIE